MLEPYLMKVTRTVLKRVQECNLLFLSDYIILNLEFRKKNNNFKNFI